MKDFAPVPQERLEAFIANKYDWKSLSSDEQKAMAFELLRARYLLQKHLEFMDKMLLDGYYSDWAKRIPRGVGPYG